MSGISGPGDTPLVGVSSCLLGNNVRYDGGHKLDRFLRDRLGNFVRFVPVCPEVECGLSIPREAMRLVNTGDAIKLLTQKTQIDITPRMSSWAEQKITDLKKLPLCGFIFKSKSPSSGMKGVKVYTEKGGVTKTGVGVFAKAFMEAFPDLPVEDEGRLNDDGIRENFIERLFVRHRWLKMLDEGFTRGKLVEFHARHKLILMAHSPAGQNELGRIVASPLDTPALIRDYHQKLMQTLALKATVKKNTNVIQHIAGYFKKVLNPREKAELVRVTEDYYNGLVPLIVPVTLLKHYVMLHGPAYLENQFYLNPHPMELMLRNHA
ncbi:MAG: DUF523 and DUF1722 domain-containing protein [Candidatus Fermentibacteraceae bacterium]